MRMADGNTAALNDYLARQDELDTDHIRYGKAARENAIEKVTTDGNWLTDLWLDNPADFLDLDLFYAACTAGDVNLIGSLVMMARRAMAEDYIDNDPDGKYEMRVSIEALKEDA